MRASVRLSSTSTVFVASAALVFGLIACGSDGVREESASGPGGGSGGKGSTSDAFAPNASPSATSADGGPAAQATPLSCGDPTNAVEGCGCPSQGAESACWTGPANLRRVDLCREGKSVCVESGEFLRWGACTGQVLPGSPGIDANCQSCCKGECNPGTARYCDEPNFCSWGKQDCLPNGQGGGSWGPCKETAVPAGCEEPIVIPGFPIPSTYDSDCCKKLGLCCQVGGVNGVNSEGNCAGITVTCQ
jgi:hypothetical protein